MQNPQELTEEFLFQNMLLYNEQCVLAKKREQLRQAYLGIERLKMMIACDEKDIALQQQQLNSVAFDLLLCTPHRQFIKLAELLDF